MKLRSAPLDDVFQELQFVLDSDNTLPARTVRWLLMLAYRGLTAAVLLALRLRWRVRRLGEP